MAFDTPRVSHAARPPRPPPSAPSTQAHEYADDPAPADVKEAMRVLATGVASSGMRFHADKSSCRVPPATPHLKYIRAPHPPPTPPPRHVVAATRAAAARARLNALIARRAATGN